MTVEPGVISDQAGAGQSQIGEEIALSDLVGLLGRRWPLILAVVVIVEALTIVWVLHMTPVYEAHALILTPSSGSGAGLSLDSVLLGQFAGGGSTSLSTEAEVIKSPAVAGQAMERLAPAVRGELPEDMGEALDARPYKSTNILEVVVSSSDPKATAALANAVAERYIQYQEDQSREQVRSVLDYVGTKIGELRADLLNAQATLRDFKERNMTVDLATEAQATVSQAADLETEARRAEAALAAAQASLQAARSEPVIIEGESLEPTEIVESPQVIDLKARITELEMQRAELVEEYTAGSPEVDSVERQLAQARGQLEEAAIESVAADLAPLQATVWSSEAQVAALRDAAGVARSRLASLPEKEYELALLQAEVMVLGQAYQMLNEQYHRLRIREESQIGGTSILAPAEVPEVPVRPRKRAIAALALVFGTVVALALALLVDYTDDRVRSEQQVAAMVGRPIVGQIPRLGRNAETRLEHLPERSPLLEAFRIVRNNVILSRPNAPPRVLALACGASCEGNSMVAANLAVAFAMAGERAVLVDADLRGPVLHERFGVPGQPGLSNVAAGDAGLDDALVPTGVENLRLLPAGDLPSDPTEVLNSQRWRALLAGLRGQVDIVIMDTPPLELFADGQIAAALADMTVLVVSMGDATAGGLSESLRLLSLANADLGGVIINRVRGRPGSGRFRHRRRT